MVNFFFFFKNDHYLLLTTQNIQGVDESLQVPYEVEVGGYDSRFIQGTWYHAELLSYFLNSALQDSDDVHMCWPFI